MATSREREAQKRQDRLEELDRLVEQGTVKVRQMTDEEREKYPPLADECAAVLRAFFAARR